MTYMRNIQPSSPSRRESPREAVNTDLYPTRNGGEVRMLPRKDPVLHRIRDVGGPLDGETLSRFERDGFWVAPSLLNPSEVEALTDALEAWRKEPLGDVSDGVIRERGSQEQRSLFALHERDDVLGEVMRHPLLVGAARQILGGDVYVHQSRLNLKPAFGGAGFSWHSDFETWHAEDGMPRMRALSASVFLTENHAWNGPLMLLPGSHRHFVSSPSLTPADHYKASLVEQSIGTPGNDALRALFADAGRIELALGGPGTVVFFECNTMHASTTNLSPMPRKNLFVCYNAVDNALVEPFGAGHPRPGFLANRDFTPIR